LPALPEFIAVVQDFQDRGSTLRAFSFLINLDPVEARIAAAKASAKAAGRPPSRGGRPSSGSDRPSSRGSIRPQWDDDDANNEVNTESIVHAEAKSHDASQITRSPHPGQKKETKQKYVLRPPWQDEHDANEETAAPVTIMDVSRGAKVGKQVLRPPWQDERDDEETPFVASKDVSRGVQAGKEPKQKQQSRTRREHVGDSISTGLPQASRPSSSKSLRKANHQEVRGYTSEPKASYIDNASCSESTTQEKGAAVEAKRKIAKLEQELADITLMHTQVLAEHDSEHFDSRRVILLKSQNAQLQRQCSIMSSSLEKRHEALTSSEHAIIMAREALEDEGHSSSLAEKTIKHLNQVLGTIHKSARQCVNSPQRICYFGSRFCADPKNFTLQEVYEGSANHLDFEAIHELESELAQLQFDLKSLASSLHIVFPTTLGRGISEHVKTNLLECRDRVGNASKEVSSLSFLIPNQNRPRKMGDSVATRGSEFVSQSFKMAAKQMKQGSPPTSVLKNLANIMKSYLEINSVETDALDHELNFYRTVYQNEASSAASSVSYDHSHGNKANASSSCAATKLLQNVKDALISFKSSCAPEDLRHMITLFDECYPQIQSALQSQPTLAVRIGQPSGLADKYAYTTTEMCELKRLELAEKLDKLLSCVDQGIVL